MKKGQMGIVKKTKPSFGEATEKYVKSLED